MKHVTYITAGAGSGKTYTLTGILASLIAAGKAEPEQFILTTFTEAAAAEFREKAKARLYEEQNFPGYAEAAERLEQALIGTVDSIAYSFIQKYWYLLNCSPDLKMLDDSQKEFFIDQLLSSIASEEETAFLTEFCEEFGIRYSFSSGKTGLNYDFWKEDVKAILEKSKSYSIDGCAESRMQSLKLADEACGSEELNVNKADLLALLDKIAVADAESEKKSKTRTEDIRKYGFLLSRKLTVSTLASFRSFLEKLPKGIKKKISDIDETAEELSGIYSSSHVKDLIVRYIQLIFDFVEKAAEKFGQYKDAHRLIDFTDMEAKFLQLLEFEEVQEDIRQSYRYVFVDEFQDSSPIQVKIFDRLSEIVGNPEYDGYTVKLGNGTDVREFHVHNSIWVGDFKQAIYGFRGADTELTKAVADIIAAMEKEQPGEYSIHSLDKSFRSLPEIVTFTNDVFIPAFAGLLDEQQVKLFPHRENTGNAQNLTCWKAEGSKGEERMRDLASQIAYRLKGSGIPSDYAVLARTNDTLDTLSQMLAELNVPVCRELKLGEERDELTLVCALLNLVQNEQDQYSRAVVAFLSQEGFDAGKIIDTRLEFKAQQDKDGTTAASYLSDCPLIHDFTERLPFYRGQTIHGLVESLVISLDLYSVGRRWKGAQGTDEAFQAIIESAVDYEERCSQADIPPTINGFMDFARKNAKSAGSKDGVVLTTFHGSKGLEWKHVILLDLDDEAGDAQHIIKSDICGVHAYHDAAPSRENLYPPMMIRLFPRLFSGNTNIDSKMKERMTGLACFDAIRKSSVSEYIRLLYVAVTRARDELIIVTEGKTPFMAFQELGCTVSPSYEFIDGRELDLLSNRHRFAFERRCLADGESYASGSRNLVALRRADSVPFERRDVQPSSVQLEDSRVNAKVVFDSGKRIELHPKSGGMDRIGSCIHNIFVFWEHDRDLAKANDLIRAYELTAEIPHAEEITASWDALEAFLTNRFGPGKTFHEVPFRHAYDGQIFTGSIDLLFETKDGCILVDYKTFPGSIDQVLNENSSAYAGKYKGQFLCYEHAITASGRTVIAKLIYYASAGVVVELT